MVRLVTDTLAAKTGVKSPPFVVELAGPAASGKSSLLRALIQSDGGFAILADPERRRIKHIPFIVTSIFSSLPVLLRQSRSGRWFTWREIKSIVYLKGWHRVLRRPTANGVIIALEKGPVLRLAQLRAFDSGNISSRRFDEWWVSLLKQWAHTLEMVVWLDAPDGILLERIRARARPRHTIKERSEKEYGEFLARYRASIEGVFSSLRASGGPMVIRFDTDQESLGQIVDKTLLAFEKEAQRAQ